MSSGSNPSSPNVSISETGSPTSSSVSSVRQMNINRAKFSHETYKGLVKSKAHRGTDYLNEAQRLHAEQKDRYDLSALVGIKRRTREDVLVLDQDEYWEPVKQTRLSDGEMLKINYFGTWDEKVAAFSKKDKVRKIMTKKSKK